MELERNETKEGSFIQKRHKNLTCFLPLSFVKFAPIQIFNLGKKSKRCIKSNGDSVANKTVYHCCKHCHCILVSEDFSMRQRLKALSNLANGIQQFVNKPTLA